MTITTEYVWESFHDPLQQFIRKHVRDASTAEDILQDVFLNIHTHLATLKDQDKLQHWLYQIARHAIIDHARRHKITGTLPDTFDPPEEPAEDDVERALLPSVSDAGLPARGIPGGSSPHGVPGAYAKGTSRAVGTVPLWGEIACAAGAGETQSAAPGLLPF